MASIYGTACILSYFLGGWPTGYPPENAGHFFCFNCIGGLYIATYPFYIMYLVLHVYWGITTVLTFWAALVKATRQLAAMSEQGKAFGFLEGGRDLPMLLSCLLL